MEKNRNKGKKTVKLSEIKLEYLKGSPVDGKTARNALTFMGSLLVMAIAFLLLGMAMMMDNAVLRVAFNGCLIAAALLMFFQTGTGQGAVAVNLGEMLYDRQQSGGKVTEIAVTGGRDEMIIEDAQLQQLIDSIYAAQNITVDTISGATMDSEAIIAAVKDAFQ